MRLVFMGTPEFAVPSLRAIVKAGFTVCAVVTQPDRPKGRGMRLTPPPVKACAQELQLPVYQPEKVRDATFVQQFQDLAPDCVAVVAFGQLIPEILLQTPPLGFINVHPSLLPKYRGATPIQQALLDGVTETGVSTMYLDMGMDTGDVILQVKTRVDADENAGDLHDRLALVGADLLVETLRLVEAGDAPRIPQDHAKATVTHKLKENDGHLDWQHSAVALVNRIRAFTPWPSAYTYYNTERLKVLKARAMPSAKSVHELHPGGILSISEEGIQVVCSEGILELQLVQPQNGRVMSAAAYAHGKRLRTGDSFRSRQSSSK
ncbi:MAG: methionyl-tRNA formyltransferase [Limnochordia bacterium]